VASYPSAERNKTFGSCIIQWGERGRGGVGVVGRGLPYNRYK
jgi:hypothetical protein